MDASYVTSNIWKIELLYDGMVLDEGSYKGTTYYFALKIGWDKQ